MRISVPTTFRPGHARPSAARPVTGTARLDRRTCRLAARLRPGDIAFIDHADLDRPAAEALVAARVAAVVNAQPSSTGRYPNLGPEALVHAGIPLVDDLGDVIFQHVRDGDQVTVDGTAVLVGDVVLGHGVRQDAARVCAATVGAWDAWAVQLGPLVADVQAYLAEDWALLADGTGVPPVRTRMAGRPCVVATRGYGHQEDLALLAPYLRDLSPVLIGVDGGADALLSAGYRPHVIVGDMEAISERALRCGAELVIRIAPDERGFGPARLVQLNLPAVAFPAALPAAELAVLLAEAYGASLIVAAGAPSTLTESLDRGRDGVASSLLARLRVGGRLVDAAAVAKLHRPTVSIRVMLLTVASALVAMGASIWFASAGRSGLGAAAGWWDAVLATARELLR
jgi:uncharacterized membrane-anchored protein